LEVKAKARTPPQALKNQENKTLQNTVGSYLANVKSRQLWYGGLSGQLIKEPLPEYLMVPIWRNGDSIGKKEKLLTSGGVKAGSYQHTTGPKVRRGKNGQGDSLKGPLYPQPPVFENLLNPPVSTGKDPPGKNSRPTGETDSE